MYICKNCNTQISSNTPSYLIQTQKRPKKYPGRHSANKFLKNGKEKISDVPGGAGWEIMQELVVCGECHRKLANSC